VSVISERIPFLVPLWKTFTVNLVAEEEVSREVQT
jgi:hypothetical protein